MKLINLDQNVMLALDFFIKNKPPKLDLGKYKMPFVIGSGNAYNTGTILFSDQAAIFADESNFRSVLKSYAPIIKKKMVTQAIIISASGEKDSVWEIELAKKAGLKTTLLTCDGNSTGAKIADKTLVYRKIAEPYTYNTSTYLGMVLSATGEKTEDIKKKIKRLKLPKNFNKYSAYSFVLPDKYLSVCPMLDIKKSELFGFNLSVRAFSQGHARHAKFVIPSEKELVISLGEKNKFFGHPKARWDIDLKNEDSYGTVIALTYYLVGKIQEAKPAYFKKNIANFCNDYGPKAYGKNTPFDLIVPGN